MHSPVFLLSRPQLGENIGAVARAMSNFGLSELRIAAPRDGWPNEKAHEMATVYAQPILDAAGIYPSFDAAMHDLHIAYATTARPRDMEKRVIEPAQAVAEIHAHLQQARKAAIVFGPERTGLTNDELVQCDTVICIPTDSVNPSLNLAQSAVIMGYEWRKQQDASLRAPAKQSMPQQVDNLIASPAAHNDGYATKEEWQGFFSHLEATLDACNYFRTPDKKPLMWQNLQTIFNRAPLSSQEVRTLRGMLRSLSRMPEE